MKSTKSLVFSAGVGVALLGLAVVRVQADQGSIVGWGSQVVVPQEELTDLVAVAAGGSHSLVLRADGSIVAWGGNLSAQWNVTAPNSGFISVAAGGSHSLGLRGDGSLVAWGWNDSGQINVPAPNSGFIAVAAGGDHSLGLKADGSIVGRGDNSYGQTNVPAPNSGLIAIAAGSVYSLGLEDDRSIAARPVAPSQKNPFAICRNAARAVFRLPHTLKVTSGNALHQFWIHIGKERHYVNDLVRVSP